MHPAGAHQDEKGLPAANLHGVVSGRTSSPRAWPLVFGIGVKAPVIEGPSRFARPALDSVGAIQSVRPHAAALRAGSIRRSRPPEALAG